MQIDGFLGPGHVSMVIGTAPYRFIAARYGKPLVIAGFEPLDVLQSVWMLLAQIDEGRCEIENQYARVADGDGNAAALAAIAAVFELREFFEWRGLGSIDHSGVRMRERYAAWDAERRFPLPRQRIADPEGLPVRRGAEGRDQAVAVQGLRQGLHPRDAAGRADGFLRGRVRGLHPVRAPRRNRAGPDA